MERACAVVVCRHACQFTFEDMQRHLLEFKIAQQYVPEHLVHLSELPMTASGKVQKFVLREKVARLLQDQREAARAKTD